VAPAFTKKFLGGGGDDTSSIVAAANTQFASVTGLTKTMRGLSGIVRDIQSISIASIKNDKLREKWERRQKRRDADQQAEELTELEKIAGKKKAKPKKPDSKEKKSFANNFKWLDTFLGPIGKFLVNLGATLAMRELLKWASDDSNFTKIETFIHKLDVVFTKLYGFGKFLVKDNLVDGFKQAFFGENADGTKSDFFQRISGIGKILIGITGLKYLMNPFSLITDILGVLDWIFNWGPPNLDGPPRGKPRRGKPPRVRGNQWWKFWQKKTKTPAQLSRFNQSYSRFIEGTANLGDRLRVVRRGGAGLEGIFDQGIQGGKLVGQGDNIFKSGLSKLGSWGEIIKKNTLKYGGKAVESIGNFGKWIAEGASAKYKAAQAWVGQGVDNLRSLPKKTMEGLQTRVLGPIAEKLQPFVKRMQGFGDSFMGLFRKMPVIREVMEALASRGINMKSIAKSGKAWGKRAASVLPLVGGLANLGFAAMSFSAGDNVGGVLESIAGVLELVGYATSGAAGAGLPLIIAGTAIDAYLLARILPKVGDKILGWEEKGLEKIGSQLNGIKSLAQNVMSKVGDPGGIIQSIMNQVNGTGKDEARPQDGVPQAGIGKFFSGLWDGVKSVGKGIWDGISGVVNTVGGVVEDIVNSPFGQILMTALPYMFPGAAWLAPLINGIKGFAALANGNPLGAIMSLWGAAGDIWTETFAGINKQIGDFFGPINNAWNNIMDSKIGQIGKELISGNITGAMGVALEGTAMEGALKGFGAQIDAMGLSGILGSIPGVGSALANIPGLSDLPGVGSLVSGNFSPAAFIGGIADTEGLGDLYQGFMGLAGGDIRSGLEGFAAQAGVDPQIFGVYDSYSEIFGSGGSSEKQAMLQIGDFDIQGVPVIIEKILVAPIPDPKAINNNARIDTGGAWTSLSTRMGL
tara:strand:- start:993 stop:3740 length:2748 start_codon:yes stop_codon:yes gene_type:complete